MLHATELLFIFAAWLLSRCFWPTSLCIRRLHEVLRKYLPFLSMMPHCCSHGTVRGTASRWANAQSVTSEIRRFAVSQSAEDKSLMNFRFVNDFLCQLPINAYD